MNVWYSNIEYLISIFFSVLLRHIDSIKTLNNKFPYSSSFSKKRRKHLYRAYSLNLTDLIFVGKILKMVFWTLRSDIKTLECRKMYFITYLTKSVNISHLTFLYPNIRATTTDKKLAVTLWYLRDTGSMKITANLFGIHQSTLCNIATGVCNIICSQRGPKFIYLLKTVVK